MPEVSSGQLQVNQPIEAPAPDAVLTIKVEANKPLLVGSHIFQLEVEDDSGNRSQPAQFQLVILDNQAPTAIITGPTRGVPFGKAFTLSGKESKDAGGGKVVKYIWTLVR